jgi:replicative DNA helicase
MEGEFVIIAARPSIGKTALALQIAINNAAMGNAVAFFSCEMSGDSIAQRSLSGATGKSNLELIQGRCEIDDLVNKSSHLFMMPLFIDDTAGISITELHSKSRKLVQKNNVKMIIVDYIQLMKGEGDTREQVVAGISRGLKSIAKDLNLPVIGLSQLNREGEGKISLSKLRESGALEQDADVVLFLERPSKQGARTVIIDNNEVDASDKMLINIAKNRNGATGEIYIKHNDSLTWFSDLDDVDLTKCTF